MERWDYVIEITVRIFVQANKLSLSLEARLPSSLQLKLDMINPRKAI